MKHLVGVCADGSAAMVGKKSGVLTKLKEKFPKIMLWHCLCHRVELAVADAVEATSHTGQPSAVCC